MFCQYISCSESSVYYLQFEMTYSTTPINFLPGTTIKEIKRKCHTLIKGQERQIERKHEKKKIRN